MTFGVSLVAFNGFIISKSVEICTWFDKRKRYKVREVKQSKECLPLIILEDFTHDQSPH